MKDEDLLLRLSRTLKTQIGPAVEGEYEKTQAYMAAVVLEKLSGQLGSKAAHENLREAEMRELASELGKLGSSMALSADLITKIETFSKNPDDTALCELIRALHKNRVGLRQDNFIKLLTPIRKKLRSSIDRRLEYSK